MSRRREYRERTRPRRVLPSRQVIMPGPDWSLTWWLPGHGEPTRNQLTGAVSCGTWEFFGHAAPAATHYRRVLRRCGRFACPTCALEPGGWAHREADAITGRVHAGCNQARKVPIHVVISPPQDVAYDSLRSYGKLRAMVYRISRRAGFLGGCAVFHHLRLGTQRWNRRRLGCRPGPHFHLIGNGWIRVAEVRLPPDEYLNAKGRQLRSRTTSNVCPACAIWKARTYLRACPDCTEEPSSHVHGRDALVKHGKWCGWFIRNLGVRVSVNSTAFYLLTHASQGILPTPEPAGVQPPRVVTWFGSMSYSALDYKAPEAPPVVCGVCKEPIPAPDWFRIVWEGSGPPPEADAGECEPGAWRAERLEWEDFGGRRTPRRVARSYLVGEGVAEETPISAWDSPPGGWPHE